MGGMPYNSTTTTDTSYIQNQSTTSLTQHTFFFPRLQKPPLHLTISDPRFEHPLTLKSERRHETSNVDEEVLESKITLYSVQPQVTTPSIPLHHHVYLPTILSTTPQFSSRSAGLVRDLRVRRLLHWEVSFGALCKKRGKGRVDSSHVPIASFLIVSSALFRFSARLLTTVRQNN